MRRALRALRAVWQARPDGRGAAIPLAAGAVASLGQAPTGLWYLAFPALAWIVLAVARAGGGLPAFWTGWLSGIGYFAVSLHWIVFPFFVDPLRHGWMSPLALVLMAAGLGLFWAAAAGLSQRLPRPALGFATLWAGAEVLRGHVLTGFPWVLAGHVWTDSPAGQVYSLLGSYGVTVATLIAAALPAAMGRWSAVVLVPLALGAAGWTAQRLALPEPPLREAVVRLVQPNAEQHLKWAPDWAERHFRRLLDLTAGDLRLDPAYDLPARVDLVVWPETSVPYRVEPGEDIARAIAAAGRGAPVAAGIQRIEGDRGWNALAVFGAGGMVTASYDKHHLVPFGEYVPYGDLMYDLFGLRAFAAQVGAGYSAGAGPRVIDLGPRLGRVLPLICYEVVFPQDIARAPERADWMLQITNDAWFGPWAGPHQHFAQARLRAIEQGLPLVRVANTGISAVIDARGRVTGPPVPGQEGPHLLALGQAGVIDAPLPGALPPTPYVRWGEAPTAILLLLGLGAALLRRRDPASA